MGSTSDMPVMKKAAEFLNDMEIPFEINALSAHRTPEMVEDFENVLNRYLDGNCSSEDVDVIKDALLNRIASLERADGSSD